MTNIKATYFSEVDMAGKLKCVPLWFIGIDIEWKSWQNSPNSKSKPMIDIDNFDSIPIYNSKPTFIAWHWCRATESLSKGIFARFWDDMMHPGCQVGIGKTPIFGDFVFLWNLSNFQMPTALSKTKIGIIKWLYILWIWPEKYFSAQKSQNFLPFIY